MKMTFVGRERMRGNPENAAAVVDRNSPQRDEVSRLLIGLEKWYKIRGWSLDLTLAPTDRCIHTNPPTGLFVLLLASRPMHWCRIMRRVFLGIAGAPKDGLGIGTWKSEVLRWRRHSDSVTV